MGGDWQGLNLKIGVILGVIEEFAYFLYLIGAEKKGHELDFKNSLIIHKPIDLSNGR